VETRPLGGDAERAWAHTLLAEHFGGTRMVTRGRLYDAAALPGLVAWRGGERVGVLVYRPEPAGDGAEVAALIAVRPREGVGAALLRAFEALAGASDWARAWLVTTNDNVGAQAFYRALGWRLAAVHRGAVAEARALKPEIPALGEGGVPIEDELEFAWEPGGPSAR